MQRKLKFRFFFFWPEYHKIMFMCEIMFIEQRNKICLVQATLSFNITDSQGHTMKKQNYMK